MVSSNPQNDPRNSPRRLVAIAITVCRKYKFPVGLDGETDYLSAVNYAVARALENYPKKIRTTSLKTYCCRRALRECQLERSRIATLKKGDYLGAARDKARPEEPTPIPLKDFELLSFIAAHGYINGSKLLGISKHKIRARLDEISFRIQQGVVG